MRLRRLPRARSSTNPIRGFDNREQSTKKVEAATSRETEPARSTQNANGRPRVGIFSDTDIHDLGEPDNGFLHTRSCLWQVRTSTTKCATIAERGDYRSTRIRRPVTFCLCNTVCFEIQRFGIHWTPERRKGHTETSG